MVRKGVKTSGLSLYVPPLIALDTLDDETTAAAAAKNFELLVALATPSEAGFIPADEYKAGESAQNNQKAADNLESLFEMVAGPSNSTEVEVGAPILTTAPNFSEQQWTELKTLATDLETEKDCADDDSFIENGQRVVEDEFDEDDEDDDDEEEEEEEEEEEVGAAAAISNIPLKRQNKMLEPTTTTPPTTPTMATAAALAKAISEQTTKDLVEEIVETVRVRCAGMLCLIFF